ncbi:FkbM family methyltransferase [Cryomorphaceae bacterium 1068]|nr:FkbM family methyltransferase [Cryomorphaceae bacterium 1068]
MLRTMIILIKKFVRPFLRGFLSRTRGLMRYQSFYQTLFDIAIRGMNFGSGDYRTSGELELLKVLRSRLSSQNDNVIFDVGSNVGSYALEIHNSFEGFEHKIHCFEPAGRTFLALEKNLGQGSEYVLNNFGFSDKATISKLYSYAGNSVLASLYERDLKAHNYEVESTEDISLDTIDAYSFRHEISFIFFLKIDVEGNEYQVLNGASRMLSEKRIKVIQFEFGEANVDSRIYMRDFFELLSNYEVFRVVLNGLVPLKSYNESLEIFKTANYVAFLK